MLAKRIIPCLDVMGSRTVKGVNFVNLKDAGDPIELAQKYSKQGADELVFLDITATENRRKTLIDITETISRKIDIPFTIGGGITSLEDVDNIFLSGADRVSINSQAFKTPKLISKIANKYGVQSIVIAIDAKCINGEWIVHLIGGKKKTTITLFDWAQQVQDLGAGEILFTSMDHDGTKKGFAIDALKELKSKVKIPIIASGGGGSINHFFNVFNEADVDGALAASIFHYNEIQIPSLKKELKNQGVEIRI